MCKLYTFSKKSFEDNTDSWLEHMDKGMKFNDDGHAALFLDETNGEHALIRSMDWNDIRDLVSIKDNWTRVFVHQRALTRGSGSLENTHFWQSGDIFYCHNGVFRGDRQAAFDVDSQVIGSILDDEGVWPALEYLQSQLYSNVFMVDTYNHEWFMSRSITNSLYTNSDGDYTTNKLVGVCDTTVPTNTIVRHKIKKKKASNYWASSALPSALLDADEEYNKAVAISIGKT